jgi:LPXTG-motif cell wall-anchored protein
MIRRTVLMVGAILVASVWFGSAAHAGSYTPPSSEAPAVAADQVSNAAVNSSGTLPQTGSDSTETLLRVGIVLVAAGGAVAFLARRRTAAAER